MSARMLSLMGALVLTSACGASGPHGTTLSEALRDGPQFDDVDTDRDAKLDHAEFAAAMEAYTRSFDADESGRLVAEELADGFFTAWDRDTSGRVSDAELRRGMVTWLPPGVTFELLQFDDDGDIGLDRAELRAGLSSLGTFATYDDDGDGGVSNGELASALFASWDLDGDAKIDALEWQFE